MSSSGSSSSAKDRREAHREEIRRKRLAELRRQRRIRTAVIATICVLALAIAAGIGYAIYRGTRPAGPVTPPQGVSAQTPYLQVGAPSGKPVVDVYVDFMCPICGQFHQINGKDIDALVAQDAVTVRLHTRTFLDSQSTTGDYSTRAANAAACVYGENPETFMAYQDLLFQNQPAEGSAGLTNAKLTELAVQAGASDAIGECISSTRHEAWLHEVVEPEAKKNDPRGTPYVLIDGKPFAAWQQPGALSAAVREAGGTPASDAGGQ